MGGPELEYLYHMIWLAEWFSGEKKNFGSGRLNFIPFSTTDLLCDLKQVFKLLLTSISTSPTLYGSSEGINNACEAIIPGAGLYGQVYNKW